MKWKKIASVMKKTILWSMQTMLLRRITISKGCTKLDIHVHGFKLKIEKWNKEMSQDTIIPPTYLAPNVIMLLTLILKYSTKIIDLFLLHILFTSMSDFIIITHFVQNILKNVMAC